MKDTDRTRIIKATISDLIGNFLYYDRKEDRSLPRGAIEQAVTDGEITSEEIVEEFRAGLLRSLP